MQIFTFLTVIVLGTACNIPVKRDIPNDKVNESNLISAEHPKLIKTIGSPRYGNVQCILQDKAGNLWFATRRHGACRYDGKSFTSFRENEDFVRYGINSILEDKKGNKWFSTDKNGVYSYEGQILKNFNEKNGLVNNSVRFILEDKNGNLWFGT